MRTSSKLLVIGALLALGSAACSDWLSGPGVTNDPNAPSTASRDQRLAAVQAGMTAQLTGALARTACMWMQQCAGVDRQYATLEKYNTTEDDFDTEFSQVYSGGGLVDIRAIASDALGAGDSVYTGVAKVLEALDVGTAADLWGDIPYSQAAGNNGTPVFDKQQDIYLRVLAVLDTAITDLAGKGSGPGGDRPVVRRRSYEVERTGSHAEGAILPPSGGAERRPGIYQRARRGEPGDLERCARSGVVPEHRDVREQPVVSVSRRAAGHGPPDGGAAGRPDHGPAQR